MFTFRTLPQEGDMTQRQNGTKIETVFFLGVHFSQSSIYELSNAIDVAR